MKVSLRNRCLSEGACRGLICLATFATLGFPSRSFDAQILEAFIMMRGKSRVHMMRGILAEVTVGAKGVPSSVEQLGMHKILPERPA
jgi:hypothetical protein